MIRKCLSSVTVSNLLRTQLQLYSPDALAVVVTDGCGFPSKICRLGSSSVGTMTDGRSSRTSTQSVHTRDIVGWKNGDYRAPSLRLRTVQVRLRARTPPFRVLTSTSTTGRLVARSDLSKGCGRKPRSARLADSVAKSHTIAACELSIRIVTRCSQPLRTCSLGQDARVTASGSFPELAARVVGKGTASLLPTIPLCRRHAGSILYT